MPERQASRWEPSASTHRGSALGRPLRIAHYATRLPEPGRKIGGVEIAVHRLANALVDSGDEVTVMSATPAPADARYRSERFLAAAPFFYRRPLPQYAVIPLALNFANFRRFDVLHLHGDDWFFVHRRIPTVRTFYGSALREAQHATKFARRALMYGVYGLERLSARICDLPLALGGDAASIYGLEDVIALGVDGEVFFPGEKHVAPRILFVGLWTGRKRGEFMFETFVRQVLPRVPNAQLVMVSDHCPSHPNVSAARFPDDRELARLFREAWVFASPSTYEGFGIPYVEALASGTPVVSTPNVGAREILGDGRFGVLAEDGDFGAAIAALLVDGERRRSMARAGLARASDYSWPAIARSHRDLYTELVSQRLGRVAVPPGTARR
jgi:glycosyltransferase involved in cell wall biosynthesis